MSRARRSLCGLWVQVRAFIFPEVVTVVPAVGCHPCPARLLFVPPTVLPALPAAPLRVPKGWQETPLHAGQGNSTDKGPGAGLCGWLTAKSESPVYTQSPGPHSPCAGPWGQCDFPRRAGDRVHCLTQSGQSASGGTVGRWPWVVAFCWRSAGLPIRLALCLPGAPRAVGGWGSERSGGLCTGEVGLSCSLGWGLEAKT